MISVIVAIYNIATYLPRCLDSLSSQSFHDVEFLLIDDGSTDASREIVEHYQRQDSRFRVFHTENRGLCAARNYGIERAKGDWLMFVDGVELDLFDLVCLFFPFYMVRSRRKRLFDQ